MRVNEQISATWWLLSNGPEALANLGEAVHPPLASVLHEVGEPLLPVVRLLLAEGLKGEKQSVVTA